MNKNCILLEILEGSFLPAIPPELSVWPELSDYEGPCSLYTEEEAAAEVDRRIKFHPDSRYQVVVVAALTP